ISQADNTAQFQSVSFDRSVADEPPIAAVKKRTVEPVAEEEAEPTTRAGRAATVDFSEAARRATPSVVYINSISQGLSYSYWDWFFGESPNRQRQVSSGSGVIFTS